MDPLLFGKELAAQKNVELKEELTKYIVLKISHY
jgi:hypothetical protein